MKVCKFIKHNFTALLISFIYVILGGIVACSLYPDDLLNGAWWFWGCIITFPVSMISCTYRMFGSDNYFPVIIIQTIMFIPTFILVKKIIKKRN